MWQNLHTRILNTEGWRSCNVIVWKKWLGVKRYCKFKIDFFFNRRSQVQSVMFSLALHIRKEFLFTRVDFHPCAQPPRECQGDKLWLSAEALKCQISSKLHIQSFWHFSHFTRHSSVCLQRKNLRTPCMALQGCSPYAADKQMLKD